MPRLKHGMVGTRTYRAWANMISRCKHGTTEAWDRQYADRGITVCDAWRTFAGFFADMGECPPGLTLDRTDNNGGYEPGNCRWATVDVQARNKRGNIWVNYEGERLCLYDACRAAGILRQSVEGKIKRNSLPVQVAFDHYIVRKSANG